MVVELGQEDNRKRLRSRNKRPQMCLDFNLSPQQVFNLFTLGLEQNYYSSSADLQLCNYYYHTLRATINLVFFSLARYTQLKFPNKN